MQNFNFLRYALIGFYQRRREKRKEKKKEEEKITKNSGLRLSDNVCTAQLGPMIKYFRLHRLGATGER